MTGNLRSDLYSSEICLIIFGANVSISDLVLSTGHSSNEAPIIVNMSNYYHYYSN